MQFWFSIITQLIDLFNRSIKDIDLQVKEKLSSNDISKILLITHFKLRELNYGKSH